MNTCIKTAIIWSLPAIWAGVALVLAVLACIGNKEAGDVGWREVLMVLVIPLAVIAMVAWLVVMLLHLCGLMSHPNHEKQKEKHNEQDR